MVSECVRPGALLVNPLEKNTMMNRIRTRIEAKRAATQLQSYYMWRPAPGRR